MAPSNASNVFGVPPANTLSNDNGGLDIPSPDPIKRVMVLGLAATILYSVIVTYRQKGKGKKGLEPTVAVTPTTPAELRRKAATGISGVAATFLLVVGWALTLVIAIMK
jgi:hypothetical protein